ncbi:MAG: NAD(P)(+) transhydrogenase (Re/Si-specific) subunit alpha [Kribbellaceae bacterium]
MTTVGVVRERGPVEHRVALVPDTVGKLRAAGLEVVVEPGAGAGAWFTDDDYRAAGATIGAAGQADVVLCVASPDPATDLRPGQLLLGLLEPLQHLELVRQWADGGVTTVSLDLLPRTLSRAQPMDALTSQANVAGYKSVLLAAAAYCGYFPMLMTAAGTVRPAAVLVLGAGVAGLQAIGTARRLGAVVTAYDVRLDSRAEVQSLGARFLDLSAVGSGAGAGGYARQLDEDERKTQQRQLAEQIARFDVVITTARLPGREPPVLVTDQALAAMRPGSVLVDLAAGELGGNVARSVPDATVVLGNGVTVIGAGNLASTMATAASNAYARNVTALVSELVRDGVPVVDLDDELQAAVVVTHQGSIVNPQVAALVGDTTMAGGAR